MNIGLQMLGMWCWNTGKQREQYPLNTLHRYMIKNPRFSYCVIIVISFRSIFRCWSRPRFRHTWAKPWSPQPAVMDVLEAAIANYHLKGCVTGGDFHCSLWWFWCCHRSQCRQSCCQSGRQSAPRGSSFALECTRLVVYPYASTLVYIPSLQHI